jgi:hypothetical protein
MKLTQEQLEAIRQRAENATPGPWKEDDVTGALVSDIGEDVAVFDAGPYIYAHDRTEANMEFIAHARTDIPSLLDHIAELEAELEKYRKILHGELRIVVKKNDVPIFDLDGVTLSVEKPVKEDDQ